MKEILTIFQNYTGSGYLTILYLMTLLYLWITEKNKTIRAIFVYGATIIQTLFFLPLFYYGYQLLDAGTYYRVLWLLPMTITISYVGVKILSKYPTGSMVFGLLLIALSGKYVYNNIYISKAENAYHIPQQVIDMCEMIMPAEDEERIMAACSDGLIHFMRQYSSEIQMPFGRDYLAPDWIYGNHPLREVMNKSQIDVVLLQQLATEYHCQYILLEKGKELLGNLEESDIYLIGETPNYSVYRNDEVEIIKK